MTNVPVPNSIQVAWCEDCDGPAAECGAWRTHEHGGVRYLIPAEVTDEMVERAAAELVRVLNGPETSWPPDWTATEPETGGTLYANELADVFRADARRILDAAFSTSRSTEEANDA